MKAQKNSRGRIKVQLFVLLILSGMLSGACSHQTCFAYTKPTHRMVKEKSKRDRNKGARNIMFPVTSYKIEKNKPVDHI